MAFFFLSLRNDAILDYKLEQVGGRLNEMDGNFHVLEESVVFIYLFYLELEIFLLRKLREVD